MRKLFRFKYEPCNGTCYAWCDALPEELTKLQPERRQELVRMMVTAHNNLCDNPDYSFGIDRDDASGMFVAHFRLPDRTDTYLNKSFSDSADTICAAVLATEIPKIIGSCNYGGNGSEDLGKEILRACEDFAFRKNHHDECPCSKAG